MSSSASREQWASEAGERSENLRKFIKAATMPTCARRSQRSRCAGARDAVRGRAAGLQPEPVQEAAQIHAGAQPVPETPESVPALGDLAISFIETADKDAEPR
jgi:hypothetical protein